MKDEIEELFADEETVAAIRIETYLYWASNPEFTSKVLELPPIQRGFVWKPKQIQDLWDSLLRGMPIGSVLLKEFTVGAQSAALDPINRTVIESQNSGFHLMDGQQRTLSMLLGFRKLEGAKHKLWIDFGEQGKNGSLFQLRVSTESQPFGYNNEGGKFSLHDRREANKSWCGENSEKKGKSNFEIFQYESVKPWKPRGNHEYLFEIHSLWNEKSDTWISLQMLYGSECDNLIKQRIDSFRRALCKLKKQWLALILIPDIEVQDDLDDPSHDYLTMLFDRISSGGTRLSPDDLLFSMIKQSWPEAHNIVHDLQKQYDIRSLMKPTDFVMTAFRLAALESKDSAIHDLDLNARTFHKHLKGLLGDSIKPGKLREFIGQDSCLLRAFKIFISLIEYDGTHNPKGIPKIMFPYLNLSMIQVVLHWIILNSDYIELLNSSKSKVTRFVLFWLLCDGDSASSVKASKIAIKEITDSPSEFPEVEIYKKITEKNEYDKRVFPALKYLSYECNKSKLNAERFREQHERAKHFFEEEYSSLYITFCAKKILLLWLQRAWIVSKFSVTSFLPVAGQDEDNVPYDFDHLVPQSNWSDLRGVPTNEVKNNNTIFTNSYHRRAIGNSIGNYRVMCSSENRARQDESLQDGLLKAEEEWGFYSFFPNDDVLEKWKVASPKKEVAANWSDERLLAFQYAVESRTLTLYRCYFDEAGFSEYFQ